MSTSLHVYSEPSLTIEYIDAIPCLKVHMVGFVKSSEFRRQCTLLLDFGIKYKKADKDLLLLFDNTKSAVVSREDISWVTENINPLLAKAGLHYVAFLPPEDLFAQRSLKNYMEETEERNTEDELVSTRTFQKENDAIEWFKKDVLKAQTAPKLHI